jgi:hypothetical protein
MQTALKRRRTKKQTRGRWGKMWRACSLQSHIHYLAGGKATPFPHYVLIIVNRFASNAARRIANRSGSRRNTAGQKSKRAQRGRRRACSLE